jgi:hypothetical protein
MLKQVTNGAYQEDKTDQVAVFTDGVKPINMDLKIVQYLLSQIQDNTKKQLDGMYNFPSGASFWIPLQAAKMYPQGSGAGLNQGQTTQAVRDGIDQSIIKNMVPSGTSVEANSKVVAAERDKLTEKIYAKTPASATSWGGGENTAVQNAVKSAITSTPVTSWGSGEPKTPDLYQPKETTPAPETPSWTSQIPGILKSFLNVFGFGNNNIGLGTGFGIGGQSSEVPKSTTGIEKLNAINFKLDINSTTTLMVDGRTLATIVEQYLRDDLLRAESGNISVTATI